MKKIKKRKTQKLILIISICLIIISCKDKKKEIVEEATYVVSVPELKDTVVFKEYNGQIRTIQHVELRVLEKGYLQNIYIDEGQKVKKGQLLFQIMPLVYQVELQKATAELAYIEVEYENTKRLADSHIVAPTELALAVAKLNKAKTEVSLAQAHLQFTEIRAPFDGIMGRFNDVRQGSLLNEGDLLTTLTDNSYMWVYFNVSESEYLNYISNHDIAKEKRRVRLKLADGNFFSNTGVVQTIEADFNNQTGTIAFRATFPNENGMLRFGQTGSIYMPLTLRKALLIPQQTTFEVLDKKYVYIIKNGVVKAQEIHIGYELPHIYEVTKGLTVKDTILVEGLRKVKDEEHIKTRFKTMYAIMCDLDHLHAE